MFPRKGIETKKVRPPAVAGQFYPADRAYLQQQIHDFLGAARPGQSPLPKAIIAPHAGYRYSGPIAASAYNWLRPGREQIRRVVLLGPAHRVHLRGLAASSAEAFATPLGDVPLDGETLAQLLQLPQMCLFDEAHAPEHGLEVHLPFLQLVLADFVLLPLLVGWAMPEQVSQVLGLAAGGPETLIVISSDLSHYYPYPVAKRLDQETTANIEALTPLQDGQACGWMAINGLLQLAKERDWQVKTVDLRNSGDTAGSRKEVVGYGAYLFSEGQNNDVPKK